MTSTSRPTTGPGLRHQAGARTFLRVAGCVLAPLGVVVFGWGLIHVFGSDGYDTPDGAYIAAFIGGLPLIGVGLMCLQIGFLGAAARFGAGETMPVAGQRGVPHRRRGSARCGTDRRRPDRCSALGADRAILPIVRSSQR